MKIIKEQNMNTRNEDILNGGKEIAAWLGESVGHVMRLGREGKLPIFKAGRLVRARKSTLIRWMAEQEDGAFPNDRDGPSGPLAA